MMRKGILISKLKCGELIKKIMKRRRGELKKGLIKQRKGNDEKQIEKAARRRLKARKRYIR